MRLKHMFFVYTPQLRADVEAALSTDRLAAYRNAVSGDLERAIDLYVWNANIASAFFGPIGVLEVSLRNALDRELTCAFTAPWYDDPAFRAIDPDFAVRIQKVKNKIGARGKTPSQARIVEELSLGFWVNLLRPGPGGAYTRYLWGPALSKAFPAGTRRSIIAGRLGPLLRFRNRVAHHEPIFWRDLPGHYNSILWMIQKVAPTLVPWVSHHARIFSGIEDGPFPSRLKF
jgi:hypothetical protein